jgi:fermentation-respiration switch protein FrsA (DUF1100 family)
MWSWSHTVGTSYLSFTATKRFINTWGKRYGKSTGSPSEKGLKIDAQTALDYVLSDNRLAKTPIVRSHHLFFGL